MVDSLGANLLLGNEFLDLFKAKFDYEHKTARLAAYGDFTVPFEVLARSFPYVRKVKTTHAVTLLPH